MQAQDSHSLGSDRWIEFIDPKDWKAAVVRFPNQPWRFYVKPNGSYDRGNWGNFLKAKDWITRELRKFSYPFSPAETLTCETLYKLSSLLQFGDTHQHHCIVRDNSLIMIRRPYSLIKSVFHSYAPFYKSSGNLKIPVLGFVPNGVEVLDLLLLKNVLLNTPEKQQRAILDKFFSVSGEFSLSNRVNNKANSWVVVFPYRREDILESLRNVLSWYHSESTKIMALYEPGTEPYHRAVVTLAVQMQRFVDMVHFSKDASGRTSRLVQEYICRLFRVAPPMPVLFQYKNIWMENGTYLPLNMALKMAWKGCQRAHLTMPV